MGSEISDPVPTLPEITLLFTPSVSRCHGFPVEKPPGDDEGYDSSCIFTMNGSELTKTCSKKNSLVLIKITWNICLQDPLCFSTSCPEYVSSPKLE